MALEGLSRVGCQKHKDGLVYLDQMGLVSVFYVFANGFYHLDPVLARHLEIEEHQTDRLNFALARVSGETLFQNTDRGLECLCSVECELAQRGFSECLHLGFDNLHVGDLVLSNDDKRGTFLNLRLR